MRNRRVRKRNYPSQNLDSFLDILTNTVGVLMFIGLFVSLLAMESDRIIKTPLRAETEKEGKFFELRNNQVFYVSNPEIDNQVNRFLSRLPNCTIPSIPDRAQSYMYQYYSNQINQYRDCTARVNRELRQFYFSNRDYRVSFVGDGALEYRSNSNAVGETNQQLKQDDSNFTNVLKDLDPQTNYIAFIVRPDSFSTFRAARDHASSLGFDVGWEPFAQDNIMVFGSGGRSVGVQ